MNDSPQLLSVFSEALERQSVAERAAYLDRACGDDADLRARVEDLLRAHERAPNFLEGGPPQRDPGATVDRLPVNERPGAIDRASQIAREGYRYNVGLKERTVANPLIALAFLQPQYRERFEFRLNGIDTSLGPDVWIVKFKEKARPTILRTPDNRNVAAMGRFWIDGASGRVMQTELETSTGDKVMTIFAYDQRLQLDVPVEMRDIAWLNGTAITGAASYTNFRRFGVVTDEKFQ